MTSVVIALVGVLIAVLTWVLGRLYGERQGRRDEQLEATVRREKALIEMGKLEARAETERELSINRVLETRDKSLSTTPTADAANALIERVEDKKP